MIGSFMRKAMLAGGSCTATSAPPVPDSLDLSIPGLILPTEVEMSWGPGSGPGDAATSYVLEASDDNFATVAATVTASGASATLTGLAENVYYDFRVKAVNCFGESAYHAAAQGQYTPLKEPTGPGNDAGLGVTVAGTTITLDWDDESSAESGYQIERSTDGVSYSLIHTTAANVETYADTGLAAGTYYYRVRAYDSNANNWSSWLVQTGSSTVVGSLSPSWSLDFSSGTPSGYTLTRASSGTYVDSSGYIASQASGTSGNSAARLTHNSSGTRLGLLVEEQRANILPNSEDFATSWAGGNCNVSTNAVNAPTNTLVADKVAANTTNASHWLRRSPVGQVAGTTYVFSVFFKAGGGAATHAVLQVETTGTDRSYAAKYDISTGARTDTDSANSPVNTDSPTQAEDFGNGWWRAWVRIQHSTGNTGLRAYVGLSNAATGVALPVFAGAAADADFIYFWGAQVEASTTIPSTFIPTTTATVTRSADLAHVLDSAITSWGDPGALVIHFYPPGQAGTLLSTDDASTAQVGIEASSTTAARAFWSSGSTSTGTIGTGVQKAVHYWNGSTSKFCINGGTVQSGTNNLTIGNTDFVTLGAEATDSSNVPGTFSQYANCVIRKVEFYSGTLTDANLQTITT
jgi:hypothetical protein